MSNNQAAVRAVRLTEQGENEEPWRLLETAVQEAVERLKTADWSGGQEAVDDDGQRIIIWEMPIGGSRRVAFDADGRLLGYARHIKRWYEWYKGRAPNSWMFFARNIPNNETLSLRDWADSLAR